MSTIYRGMLGMGDNFYQRAVVRELGEIQLITPWPQLYADLPVRCIRPATLLRTQRKNLERPDMPYRRPTRGTEHRLGYGGPGPTVVESMCRSVGLVRETLDFSMPLAGLPVKPVLLVRPATVRREWPAANRNPRPEYLAAACDALRDEFRIISVADLEPGEEWLVGDAPFAHETYHHGELQLEDLLQVLEGSAGAVGGVGWLLPACVAYQVPMLCIYGGWGVYNSPQRLLDPRMPAGLVVNAVPDHLCMCSSNLHDCDRTINPTVLEASIERFKQLARARATGVAA